MKAFTTVLTLLSLAWAHSNDVQGQGDQLQRDAQASAGDSVDLESLADYEAIGDTCNHPVLLSAAAFASNFFCQNVLMIAVPDIDCEALQYQVVEAKAQIVKGANFKQTVVLFDKEKECVIGFKSKIFMPLAHSGLEPEVFMEELTALACEDAKFTQVCLNSLSNINKYWEEDIVNGGGAEPISSLAEEEKVEEKEEEMIEKVEEDIAKEPKLDLPTKEGNENKSGESNSESESGSPTSPRDASPSAAPSESGAPTGVAPESPASTANNTPAGPSASFTNSTLSSEIDGVVMSNITVNTSLSGILALGLNTTTSPAGAAEVLAALELDLLKKISTLEDEIKTEEEIQEKQVSAFENEEEEYEDESTWAFAGKTDECSRFGVSPAEGIAFKCGKTVYICGENTTFREKFVLLLQNPMVDGCNLGGVSEIFASRGDCNFFPKNEHYLKRDGSQKEGHHLYCPNGSALDSYYMFCTKEVDNYSCNGAGCETCVGTSRRGRFLRFSG